MAKCNERDGSDRERIRELEAEAKTLRRMGVGSVIVGGLMCVPAIILHGMGYEVQTFNTPYETIAGVSMLCSFVPFVGGLLMYMEGNVKYLPRNGKDSDRMN